MTVASTAASRHSAPWACPCSGHGGAAGRSPARRHRLTARALLALPVLVAACASAPPAPEWQMNAKAASERAIEAYLSGNARVDAAESARARAEVARTGRVDLLARVELAHCAVQVASLQFGPCAAFEPLRLDAAPPERAYADYLAGRIDTAGAALLPEAHRAVVAQPGALAGIADPLSRLIAAGVLFETNRADPATLQTAIDTASAEGWRRPLLAWLQVQLKRVESGGALTEAEALRRRIALVEGRPAAP